MEAVNRPLRLVGVLATVAMIAHAVAFGITREYIYLIFAVGYGIAAGYTFRAAIKVGR